MSASIPVSFVVIIPTKNRLRLVQRALRSVLSQPYAHFRVVVVDDGSTDGTREYLNDLNDTRVSVLRNEVSRGVNAARNAALATLVGAEWAVPLDDDDELLPGAFGVMANAIETAPSSFEIIFFNTAIKAPEEEFVGGYQSFGDSMFYDPSYIEVISKSGLRGDCKPILRASLIHRGYHFEEEINGLESEFYAKAARDGVGIRYCKETSMRIDQRHGEERLSDTAAVRDPRSFVRANERMFRDHETLYRAHPWLARKRAAAAFKVAIRAGMPVKATSFLWHWVRFATRSLLCPGGKAIA